MKAPHGFLYIAAADVKQLHRSLWRNTVTM